MSFPPKEHGPVVLGGGLCNPGPESTEEQDPDLDQLASYFHCSAGLLQQVRGSLLRGRRSGLHPAASDWSHWKASGSVGKWTGSLVTVVTEHRRAETLQTAKGTGPGSSPSPEHTPPQQWDDPRLFRRSAVGGADTTGRLCSRHRCCASDCKALPLFLRFGGALEGDGARQQPNN